jgi:hypothetical protein
MVRNFHIVLTDGTTLRHVKASEAEVQGGALVLTNANGNLAVSYGPGAWQSCTLETKAGSSAPDEDEDDEET